ncbi:MAG: ATPase domain-containing protein [Candidatus Diapherotrites archaeon]|nr:ATPase domain-containing protein [Candidatus Diapherotrites archaeon]
MVEKIQTGIEGLDKLLQGGFPKGAIVLLSGGAGTLKTIAATQFLYNGAKLYKEPGIFVTVEESVKNIGWNIESFNWDIKGLEEKNLIKLYRLKLNPERDIKTQVDEELKTIGDLIKKIGAKRLVIDSTTAFGVWIKEPGELRYLLYKFTNDLKELGCTTILTAETKGGKTDFSAFGVEEFVVDGVVAMYFSPPNRSIFVRKMRGTDHSKKVHPMELNANGVEVKSKDEVMWESIK